MQTPLCPLSLHRERLWSGFRRSKRIDFVSLTGDDSMKDPKFGEVGEVRRADTEEEIETIGRTGVSCRL